MLFGILGFSYASFDHFAQAIEHRGFYTANLGDFCQTLAARALLRRCGVADEQVVRIDRDSLANYAGPPVQLLMNAAFRGPEFPVAPSIHPIFIGFSARKDTLESNADYFSRHQPIGCRDPATCESLRSLGIDAYVSGCVTLTLERRSRDPAERRTLIVTGEPNAPLPAGAIAAIPPPLLDTAQVLQHRLPVFELPLSDRYQDQLETYEMSLINRYRDEATLVITPLHHVAAPCLALGVPTVLLRHRDDDRFGFLKSMTPVYTAADLDRINWDPRPVDTEPVRRRFETAIKARLAAGYT